MHFQKKKKKKKKKKKSDGIFVNNLNFWDERDKSKFQKKNMG